jgi:flavin reductase (DIM6/NTAB) family NADH-FMN oxidoreductase RutF
MHLHADSADTEEYAWMVKNAVVPRPIAWVSTCDADGNGNIAPYSYFNLVVMYPPMLMVSFIGQKDSYDNIEASGEFVVNLVSGHHMDAQNSTASPVPAHIDEADLIGLPMAPSSLVRPGRVRDADVALECRHHSEVRLHEAKLVFADVVAVYVNEEVLGADGRIDIGPYQPVGRLGGSLYTTVRDSVRIPVPAPTPEWLAAQPGYARIASDIPVSAPAAAEARG